MVCPRSHPASPYARPFQGLAGGSQSAPGGRPPGTPRWGARYGRPSVAAQVVDGLPCGLGTASVARDLLAAGTPTGLRLTFRFSPPRCVRKPSPPAVSGQVCRSSHVCGARDGKALTVLKRATGRNCPAESGAALVRRLPGRRRLPTAGSRNTQAKARCAPSPPPASGYPRRPRPMTAGRATIRQPARH